MYNAIKKYGWDNIHTDIVVEGLTQQEVNEMEIRYIAILRSADDRYGYNISLGGGGKNLGKNCRGKDYRKVEKNEYRRRRYNEDEEYRKLYNKRVNKYRKKSSRYKEYQKEYQRKKREEYLQSEEYQQKMKEKVRLEQERKEKRIEKEKEKECKRLEKEQCRMEKERLKNQLKEQGKIRREQSEMIIHNERMEKVSHSNTRAHILKRVYEQMRRSNTEETRMKWYNELQLLKSVPIVD